MVMKAKSYNKTLITTIFCALLFTGIFNIVVDPYNIFNFEPIKHFNYYKPEIKRSERLTKFLSLKTIKNIDTVFVGTSRTDWSLEYDYYKKITGKNAFNIAMNGMNYAEMKDIVLKAIKIHPEIKTVLFSLDFILETEDDDGQNKLDIKNINKNISFTEIAPIIFSADTFVSSVTTIIKNVSSTDKKRYSFNGVKKPFINNNIAESFADMIDGYKNTGKKLQPNDIDYDDLRNFIYELNQKGINVILYMPPVHVTFMEILDKNGAWDKIDIIKTELSKVQPFYDFMYMDEINSEEIKPDMKNYFEASHATCFTGRKILDKIFLNQGNYGVLVNPENIEKHNLVNKNNFKHWQNNNTQIKQYVNEIMERGD